VDVDQVDDDTGGLVQTTSVPSSLTVENQTTPFPDGLPGGAPESGVPTDPDGDGLFEDLDGDGDFDFVDVIEFVFAIDSLDNLSQEQIEALDFDGSGSVDFVDVIDLVFDPAL
jgi:PKD repeat protein